MPRVGVGYVCCGYIIMGLLASLPICQLSLTGGGEDGGGALTLRVPAALELEVGGDAVDLRVELHAPLGALLLRAQLALLVLPATHNKRVLGS